MDLFLKCPSGNIKSHAVLRPLFLPKLFVLFADTKHFSLFLLSLTNDSLFVLQGRWWKKSVLATSSVVIILFLLSPIPDCEAVHWLFLVTEALPPWLSPAQHLSVSVVPSNVYSVVSIFIQRGCYCCRKVEAGRASPSLRSSLLTANDSESSIRGSSSLWCAKTVPLSSWPACLSAGFCHLGDSSDCRDSFNILRVRASHQTQISSLCLKVRDVEKSLDVVVPFQILKVPFSLLAYGEIKKK